MLKQYLDLDHREHFFVACSGGVDSMAVADFYKRGGKDFSLAYFNHGTPQADQMEVHVQAWGAQNNISVRVGRLTGTRSKGESPEEFFRNARYAWLATLQSKIVTCHHLNDAAETWLFTSMHGEAKLMEPMGLVWSETAYVVRPFIMNPKAELIKWCQSHDVKWVEDTSNEDINTPRNRIRHNILHEVLKINPGFLTVMRKKYL